MNKSLIWELVKINILYSNPQLLASVKKKQNKNKDGRFSAYRSILIQQGFLILMMAILYSVFFLGIDYKRSTGFFSLQLALFAILATVYSFTGFFFYHLSSPSRYLTKNILSLVIQIWNLFYFGLKFSVKSVYKSNTLFCDFFDKVLQ
ncbi:TPA: hypothetical protein ACGO67_001954 [Streptococcus suis]